MKWVTITTVAPCSRTRSISSQATRRDAGVQPGCHLVQEDHLRCIHQGQSDEQPLLLSAGQARERGVALVRQAPLIHHRLPRQPTRAQRGEQLQCLPDLHPIGQGRFLQLGPDVTAELVRLTGRVETQHPHRPAIETAQPLQALHRGRLPATVRPEDPEDLPRLYLETDVTDRNDSAVTLLEVFHHNHRDSHPRDPPLSGIRHPRPS